MIYLLMAGTLMTACSADNPGQEQTGRVPISLGYTTVTIDQTRAANDVNGGTSLTEGSVKVNVKKHGDSWDATKAKTYTAGAGGTLSATDQWYYYDDGSAVDIIAYYPAGAGTSFTVATDQSIDGDPDAASEAGRGYKGSDLMWATPIVNQARTPATLTLQLNHKMAKIGVKPILGTGVTSITKITLKSILPTVTFDQTTGAVGAASGTATEIVVAGSDENTTNLADGTATYAAVIPEQTLAAGAFLEIIADGHAATYSLAASKTFYAGHQYTLNIEVNSAALGTIVGIEGWTSEGSVTVQPTVEKLFPGALSGKFTIDAAGHKVNFSQGNLQATYNGSSWTWAFAENQWDCILGRQSEVSVTETGNNFINADGTMSSSGTVDLFGWVGVSSTWTDEARLHGITSSKETNSTDSYGNRTSDFLKSDWGNLPITNGGGAAGSGWRTLTGGDSGEWLYLLNSRSASTVNGTADARYAKARVNDVFGVILFPDVYTHPTGVPAPIGINATDETGYDGYDGNSYYGDDWMKMESAGCVFLPMAGWRNGASVHYGAGGFYWSSTPLVSNASNACSVYFRNVDLIPAGSSSRYQGHSVRLVRQVE